MRGADPSCPLGLPIGKLFFSWQRQGEDSRELSMNANPHKKLNVTVTLRTVQQSGALAPSLRLPLARCKTLTEKGHIHGWIGSTLKLSLPLLVLLGTRHMTNPWRLEENSSAIFIPRLFYRYFCSTQLHGGLTSVLVMRF